MEFGKGFGAVPALQQERLAGRSAGKLRLQRACLAGEDQWRYGAEFGLDTGKRCRIGILGRLCNRTRTPALR